MENKQTLRHSYKQWRDNLPLSSVLDISNIIVKNIALWDKYKSAENIMLFYPIKSEISLLSLLNDSFKSFYFPVVEGNNIFPVRYEKEKGFKIGDFQINEPIGSKMNDFSIIDLIFTPALAVDKNGYRLGYGKGFYDRFFEHFNNDVVKVVPTYSELFVEKIPIDEYDKRVDYVITEEKIYPTHHSILNS